MKTKNKQIQGERKTFNIDKELWKKLKHLKIDEDFETWDELFEELYQDYIKSKNLK